MLSASYTTQSELIAYLQHIRTPGLDSFFKVLNLIDTQEFMFILIPTVWIGIHWKEGLKLFYIVLLSALLNMILKDIFQHPRPYHLNPLLGVIQVKGYGFPSGAAQSAVFLSGILLSYKKNLWTYLVAINFFLWLSFSRLYLGVHFFTDLIGGWCIGAVLLLAYLYLFPKVTAFLEKKPLSWAYALSFGGPLLISLSYPTLAVLKICAIMAAGGLGCCLSLAHGWNLDYPKSLSEALARSVFGVLGLFIVYAGLSLLPIENLWLAQIGTFFGLGLWLSLGSNWLWRSAFRQRLLD